MSYETILDLYRNEVEAPRAEHYFFFAPGQKRVLSTEQFFKRTAALASGLEKLGITKGDRVMLISDNRPEWHMCDLAIADLGAADVPVYGTLTPEAVAYQAKDSNAVAAIADSAEQMAKFLEIMDECPNLKHLIQIDPEVVEPALFIEDVIVSGESPDAGELFWKRAEAVKGEDLLTLIYTSGTTGKPKGVSLTHTNLVANVMAAHDRAPLEATGCGLEFLPLCHVLERMVGYLYMYKAVSKAYCSVYHVGDLLTEIKPTVFAGVPRFYEKVHDKIMGKVATATGLKLKLFNFATSTGRQMIPYRLSGRSPGFVLGMKYSIADKLVLSKIREGLGGRLDLCISGGAPLPAFVNEFFQSLGVWVLEGYGLTETSPVIAVNGAFPNLTKIGTVGKAVKGVDVKIADDGELIVKGPSVMSGYWNLPEKTAEVFDKDGYFMTGDIAEIDDEGFIKITDRKKDLIVTAGGKNIAPQPIENELKRSIFVDNAVLIGDAKKFVSCLISPNSEELEPWAKAHDIAYTSIEDLTAKPEVMAKFEEIVTETNKNLARYEQIKKYKVLPLTLSIDGGHLTPTLKVKRRVVEKEYQALIDAMYES